MAGEKKKKPKKYRYFVAYAWSAKDASMWGLGFMDVTLNQPITCGQDLLNILASAELGPGRPEDYNVIPLNWKEF